MRTEEILSTLKEKKDKSKTIQKLRESDEQTNNKINESLREILVNTIVSTIQYHEIDTKEENIENAMNFLQTGPYKNTIIEKQEFIKRTIEEYKKVYKELEDNEKTMKRLSTTESFKALAFRIATTLGVGLCIMFIYWLANELSVPLPLIRIPI